MNWMKEKVYGNYAIVYHRTPVEDLADIVQSSGFRPGSGDTYGRGFYATYELASQDRRQMKDYGSVVVKFAVPTNGFLFFDWEPFKVTPLAKELKATEDNFLSRQLSYHLLRQDVRGGKEAEAFEDKRLKAFDAYNKKHEFSSDTARMLVELLHLDKRLRGIVFTGRRDGRVLVSYDTKSIIPLAVRKDGEKDFTPITRDAQYRSNAFKSKAAPPEFSVGEPKFATWFKPSFASGNALYALLADDKMLFKKGTYEGGLWKGGVWKSGTLLNTVWLEGSWHSGSFQGGEWKYGTWYGGEFVNSRWVDGTWYGGEFRDSIWVNGEWKGGVWGGGWIYDPFKIGDYSPTARWDDDYVWSEIDPAQHWDKDKLRAKLEANKAASDAKAAASK